MESVDSFQKNFKNLPHWQMPGSIYWVTFRTINHFILSPNHRNIVLETILFDEGKRHKLYCCVIMPDHVHLIVQPSQNKKPNQYWPLGKLIQSWKVVSAKRIQKTTGKTGSIWQSERMDRIIRNEKEYMEKLSYVLDNPVRAGLVMNWKDYQWLFLRECL